MKQLYKYWTWSREEPEHRTESTGHFKNSPNRRPSDCLVGLIRDLSIGLILSFIFFWPLRLDSRVKNGLRMAVVIARISKKKKVPPRW